MQRMELSGQIEIREPEGWDRSTDLNAAFTVNVVLPLATGQPYTWALEVGGKELTSTSFYVRSASPSQPTPG